MKPSEEFLQKAFLFGACSGVGPFMRGAFVSEMSPVVSGEAGRIVCFASWSGYFLA
jgi:hypothetical protein